MIKISPAILHDSSVFICKAYQMKFNGCFLDFFSVNKDLFEIKTPSIVQNFINKLSLTPKDLISENIENCQISVKKEIIIRFIRFLDPEWRKRITWGIKLEVFDYLKDKHANLFRCLEDCHLISENFSVIAWWYKNIARTDDYKKTIIGAQGEWLSYFYENQILNIDTKFIDHVSLKKSNVGYDILSVLSSKNDELKPIEVKTTTITEDSSIYITQNEWKKSSIHNYIFHLWVINSKTNKANLYFIHPNEIKKHIPKNQGLGTWKTVEINAKEYCRKVITTLDISILSK